MVTKDEKNERDYVDHPRYGNCPRFTDTGISVAEVMKSHWFYRESEIIPGTAIKADMNKQKFRMEARAHYVDLERKCAEYNRWFIFFADEQRYWYEVVKFDVKADCIDCYDCRKEKRELKALARKYEALTKQGTKTESERKDYQDLALKLYKRGYLKKQTLINKGINVPDNQGED